jgi:DNA mismatch repair ATPase MutS
VVRVVSPGTLTDASYLDAREPAFLMAIAPTAGAHGRATEYGVAIIDLSTGEFDVAEYTGPDGLQALQDELAVLHPREIVVATGYDVRTDLPEVARLGMPDHRRRRLAFRPRERAPDAARSAAGVEPRRLRPRAPPGRRWPLAARWSATCATRRRPIWRTSAACA